MSPRRWWQSDPTGLTLWQRDPLGVVQIVLLGVLGALALLAGCSVDDPCSTPEDQQVTTSTATSSTLPTTTAAILVATLALPIGCASEDPDPTSPTSSSSSSSSSATTNAETPAAWGEDCQPPLEPIPGGCPFGPCPTNDGTPCEEPLYCLAPNGVGVCLEVCEAADDCERDGVFVTWACEENQCVVVCQSDLDCLGSINLGDCVGGVCTPE